MLFPQFLELSQFCKSSTLLFQALKEKELGNAAYKNKDFETALKHYEEAIKHDPTNMTYISNQAGKYSDTLEIVKITHNSDFFHIYNSL